MSDILLPELGEGITSVEISEVLVKKGDTVKVDDPIIVDYDKESAIISPTVYFTASASLDYKISEARSLGARAMRWNPDNVLSTSLAEVTR